MEVLTFESNSKLNVTHENGWIVFKLESENHSASWHMSVREAVELSEIIKIKAHHCAAERVKNGRI